jgi:UDP-N-acetylmuramoyl-tripeptide--D-alanyl-D-alanine ligase
VNINIEELHHLFLTTTRVCTDSRKITPGCLYIALKGPNFNGNEFAEEALSKGAKYVIVETKSLRSNPKALVVDDALKTLQELSNFHRRKLDIPIIALTGSNGKTTTKELIHSVLSQKYTTTATEGNLNNHIGVPLTLLKMNASTQIGVVEMGANHINEINFLCKIAAPNYGYITNFGKAHLEGFGSVEGVIQGKTELYQYLKEKGETIFFNAEDMTQCKQLKDYEQKYGHASNSSAAIKVKLLAINPTLELEFESEIIQSKISGDYNYNNICAAITIGKYFKLSTKEIKAGIEKYEASNNRSQIIELANNRIILDAYNANPSSMEAAINNLKETEHANKIVILGDMFELGPYSAKEHQKIINLCHSSNFEYCYFVGKSFYQSKERHKNQAFFKNIKELKQQLRLREIKNKLILCKGSRGMQLEKIFL